MTTPVWPSTLPKPDYPLEEKSYKPQVRIEFEANYVQSRAAAKRKRKKFPLRWSLMTEADYQTLESFWDDNQGGLFAWTHPETLTTYTCRFSGDELVGSLVQPGYRKVEVDIEEV